MVFKMNKRCDKTFFNREFVTSMAQICHKHGTKKNMSSWEGTMVTSNAVILMLYN